jgi:hypothetical protein
MKRNEVFEVIEPPPFGLERLRARMAEQRRAPTRWVLVGAVATLVLVLVWWPRTGAVDLVGATSGFLSEPTRDVTSLDASTGGVLELPSSNPDVILARVATLEP